MAVAAVDEWEFSVAGRCVGRRRACIDAVQRNMYEIFYGNTMRPFVENYLF